MRGVTNINEMTKNWTEVEIICNKKKVSGKMSKKKNNGKNAFMLLQHKKTYERFYDKTRFNFALHATNKMKIKEKDKSHVAVYENMKRSNSLQW